jgi:hypothetical protein
MAVALEAGILNLLLKFLADALILLHAANPAGAIASGLLETLTDGSDNFLIFI